MELLFSGHYFAVILLEINNYRFICDAISLFFFLLWLFSEMFSLFDWHLIPTFTKKGEQNGWCVLSLCKANVLTAISIA